MDYYTVTLFRTDGQYANHFTTLVDAMACYEDVTKEPDEKRFCTLLHGPDTWVTSYK